MDRSTPPVTGALPSTRKNILFVAEDPTEIRALGSSFADMRPKWRLEFAVNAPNALAWIKEVTFDAVVLDLLMAETDGARLLHDLAAVRPEALRIGLTNANDRERLQKADAPAHQFLVKPWDANALKAVLARAFAASDSVAHQHFSRLVSGLHALPALPGLYVELLEELRSEDPSLERAGQIVAQDPAITAKILQLVNSAFFGLTRAIIGPAEAAMFLGTETLKALVLSLQVFSQYEHLKDFNLESLWQHSWATGVLARRICEQEGADRETTAQAFIAGLMHDLGKLVIAANQHENYTAALRLAERKGISFGEAEYQVFNTSHAEIGAFLLTRWGLPEPVIEAIAFHHRPGASRTTEFCPLTAVHAANVFSKEKQAGSCAVSQPIDVDYLRGLNLEQRLEAWHGLCAGSLEQAA